MVSGRFFVLAGVDGAVLVAGRDALPRLVHGLAGPSTWVDRVGADHAAATFAAAALWCVAVWVAIGLLSAVAGALPGAAGRSADRLARLVLPITIYRLVAGAAGLGVLLAPAAAGATPPTPSSSAPAPSWPSDAPLPAPSWPTTAPPHHQATHDAPARARRSAPHPVVVQSGDTLWSIAADHLPRDARPAQIARAWPRWYGANRAVIGDDPDLIHPGQVLHVPTPEEHRT